MSANAIGAFVSSTGEPLTGIKIAMDGGNFVVDVMRAGRIQQVMYWPGGTPWSIRPRWSATVLDSLAQKEQK